MSMKRCGAERECECREETLVSLVERRDTWLIRN